MPWSDAAIEAAWKAFDESRWKSHNAQMQDALEAAVREKTHVVPDLTDHGLRQLWRGAGGSFHGPHVETGTMEEAKLLPFLRRLLSASGGNRD